MWGFEREERTSIGKHNSNCKGYGHVLVYPNITSVDSDRNWNIFFACTHLLKRPVEIPGRLTNKDPTFVREQGINHAGWHAITAIDSFIQLKKREFIPRLSIMICHKMSKRIRTATSTWFFHYMHYCKVYLWQYLNWITLWLPVHVSHVSSHLPFFWQHL